MKLKNLQYDLTFYLQVEFEDNTTSTFTAKLNECKSGKTVSKKSINKIAKDVGKVFNKKVVEAFCISEKEYMKLTETLENNGSVGYEQEISC